MKFIIIPALLISQCVVAQTNIFKEIVPVYSKQNEISGLKTLEVPVIFNQSILQSTIPSEIKGLTIQRIDLVYSLYAESSGFDQDSLNKKRLSVLKKSMISTKNPLIEWRIIGQSQAKDNESARNLYHGFVVYYRPTPTKESIDAEISFIDSFLEGKIPLTAVSTPITSSIAPVEHTTFLNSEIAITSDRIREYIDTTIILGSPLIGLTPSWSAATVGDYNVMSEVFNRYPIWKNTIVVMDVTGSMSPYIAQTMAWVKETQSNSHINAFVFFNDGNHKANKDKQVGSAGGIYTVVNTSFDAVYKQLKSTMQKGGGGDCPENNIEAVILGEKQFPNCDEIIMMADNFATPRDLSLAASLNKPIHIVVCGASAGINIEYLQLAYNSGGSIHTIEDDIDMRSIKVGGQFKIGANYFTLLNEKIYRAQHK